MRPIDADALKARLELDKQIRGGSMYAGIMSYIIDSTPTVDAVPVVHGQWEEETVDSYEENAVIADWQSARCSVCKRYLTTPYMYYFEHYDYCPNCGTKMSAKEDGEC